MSLTYDEQSEQNQEPNKNRNTLVVLFAITAVAAGLVLTQIKDKFNSTNSFSLEPVTGHVEHLPLQEGEGGVQTTESFGSISLPPVGGEYPSEIQRDQLEGFELASDDRNQLDGTSLDDHDFDNILLQQHYVSNDLLANSPILHDLYRKSGTLLVQDPTVFAMPEFQDYLLRLDEIPEELDIPESEIEHPSQVFAYIQQMDLVEKFGRYIVLRDLYLGYLERLNENEHAKYSNILVDAYARAHFDQSVFDIAMQLQFEIGYLSSLYDSAIHQNPTFNINFSMTEEAKGLYGILETTIVLLDSTSEQFKRLETGMPLTGPEIKEMSALLNSLRAARDFVYFADRWQTYIGPYSN